MKSSKGAAWEREFAKELSLWASCGKHDDWFWRSQTSGGRATQRAKSGKNTANAVGDIAAMTQEGQKLLDRVTIELKRGYPGMSLLDVLDSRQKEPIFIRFISQAQKQACAAGTNIWWLVIKRDRREPLLITNDAIILGGHNQKQALLVIPFEKKDIEIWIGTWAAFKGLFANMQEYFIDLL